MAMINAAYVATDATGSGCLQPMTTTTQRAGKIYSTIVFTTKEGAKRRIVGGTSIRKAVMTTGIQPSCRFVQNSVRRSYTVTMAAAVLDWLGLGLYHENSVP